MSTEPETPFASWQQFDALDLRIGQIIRAEIFPEARKPAFQLWIDFGPLGVKKSSAQITADYTLEELKGKKVAAVVNFPPKQIAHFQSECLVLGVVSGSNVTLLVPDKPVENGWRIA